MFRRFSVALLLLASISGPALAAPHKNAPRSHKAIPHSSALRITPKMLSAFDNPLISSTAGVHIASVLLTQAWKSRSTAPRRAHAVALAKSSLFSSRTLLSRALAEARRHHRKTGELQRQYRAVAKALTALNRLPAKPNLAQLRKAAGSSSLALLQGDVALGRHDRHGVAKERAAAVNALIGEDGLIALIGENGSKAIIGENGSKAIIGESGSKALIGEDGTHALIGEDGIMALNALIGEDGLVADTVAKTGSVPKLAGHAHKLAAQQRTLAGALHSGRAGAAVGSALRQAALANTAMVRSLGGH